MSTNDTPVGRDPVVVSVGVGEPVAVTVNILGRLAVNTVLLALEIAGGMFTIKVKFWIATGDIPLCALKTRL